ncbi:MAG: transporter substrate-binding domain-containing protein [Syntrophomonas sp.]
MKKVTTKAIVLILMLAMGLLAGCGGTGSSAKNAALQSATENKTSQTLEKQLAAEGKTVRLGTLTFNNLTQEQLSEKLNTHYQDAGKNYKFAYTYFDSLSSALLALQAEKIDRIDMSQSTAKYIAANNSNMSIRALHWDALDFQMAVIEKNAALLDEINTAIAGMKSDGTLKTLTNNHIDSVLNGAEPEKVKMPVSKGAKTIRVAVTGDLPPMDYITTDGHPAGFNMAFLAELSKRINTKIELVNIDSGARITALSSGAVDALFWARTTGDAKFQADVPKGMKLSNVYFTDAFYGVYLKTEE